MNDGATQKLAEDFKVLTRDVEAALRATASEAGEHIGDLRQRLKNTIDSGRKVLAGSNKTWSQAAEETKARAESCLHENTWLSLAAAAGIGVILGFLMRRRD